ncbi:haloacid dehalogenase-like hydrolase [Silvibacterium dinghuense]|uniref:Haloacid dehalogenase-like hydrolase n=1 Tax=Silvibacterium dinghuense TaxID=1560006 RepID=A0A4Q1SKQ2_9BACT|nr:haloacid dehalogenase-like hydrolase [Silvibacterium dinghuense]
MAVFDCDGTLWGGDAGYGFMIWSIETGLVSRNAADWIDSRYRQYRAGEVSEAEMCGEMVQIYAGLREEELRHAAEEYFRHHIEAHIFEEMRDLLARLTQDGVELWAVSSTNHWVIEEGVKRFGISPSRVLAARVRVDDGLITSQLLAVPTDEAKASGLVEAGVPNPDAVFGNSIHDAAMLAIARKAFPVNPTPALSTISAEQGWTVFYPKAVLADQKL